MVRYWDLIGLGVDGGLPSDEYDSYAWRVVSLLLRGAPEFEIADYLDRAASMSLGCPLPRDRSVRVANRLVLLRDKKATT